MLFCMKTDAAKLGVKITIALFFGKVLLNKFPYIFDVIINFFYIYIFKQNVSFGGNLSLWKLG